jgi:hypothetical protein
MFVEKFKCLQPEYVGNDGCTLQRAPRLRDLGPGAEQTLEGKRMTKNNHNQHVDEKRCYRLL